MDTLSIDLQKRRLRELDKQLLRDIANKRNNTKESDNKMNDFIKNHDKYLCLKTYKKDMDKLTEELERFKQDKIFFLSEKTKSDIMLQETSKEIEKYKHKVLNLNNEIEKLNTANNLLISEKNELEDKFKDSERNKTYKLNKLNSEIESLSQKVERRDIIIIQNEQTISKDEVFIKKLLTDIEELKRRNSSLNDQNLLMNDEVYELRHQNKNNNLT